MCHKYLALWTQLRTSNISQKSKLLLPWSILCTGGATSTSAKHSYRVAWNNLTAEELCSVTHTPIPELAMRYTAWSLSRLQLKDVWERKRYPHYKLSFTFPSELNMAFLTVEKSLEMTVSPRLLKWLCWRWQHYSPGHTTIDRELLSCRRLLQTLRCEASRDCLLPKRNLITKWNVSLQEKYALDYECCAA